MALDPQPTPTTTTAAPTATTTRPLTNINTNTSPAQPARPVYVQNPRPYHQHYQHHQIPHLYPQVRSPNPAQQGILYPVASSGRGFIPKPPLQNSVTVATNNNVTTAATTTTPTSGVGVGYPPRPLVSYPQVHVMRPPLHHLHQQHPTSQLPSATNPIKGIPISTHQKVAPPTSVSDYNGYKDPRDKSMGAFSRGKTVDESLYTIRDRKVNITPDGSLYALCRSWLRNGISEEFQPQYGDVVRPFPKPLPISTASAHLSKKKEGEEEDEEVLDFPGGKVAFTPEMRFISESPVERVHCYRVLDDNGQVIMSSKFKLVSEEIAVKMYSDMVTMQTMDSIFYEAQRQGRISFYATTIGEEAINIASAAALTMNDLVFPQYREPRVLLWRGFSLQEFANQCFGNKDDYGKGRQMPIHYGSHKHNYFTVAATIATLVPHAVGAAYSLKMDRKKACVITYIGDGGTSEGDFHTALNFVVRGPAYGVRSIQVGGNDTLAIYTAVHAAREMAISENRPILIGALTYCVGHHSTSDDSTKYRPVDEIEWWRSARDPVARFRKWIESNGWWCSEDESELRTSVRKQMLHAIQVAEKADKPPIAELFTDVYNVPPSNLCEQEKFLRETMKRHPQDQMPDVPV